MKKHLIVLFLSLSLINANAQPKNYTTANAHSHNDYEQAKPFYSAYTQQFGSIEADVFYVPGSDLLLVGHEQRQIASNPRTLDSLYLIPIAKALKSHNGFPYADTSRNLQLMIDIKTGAEETLDILIKSLKKYPQLKTDRIQIIISGNRPDVKKFNTYRSFVLFDGNLTATYTPNELQSIGMISSSFASFSNWNGSGEFPENDRIRLQSAIDRAHASGKKVRLWAIPDHPAAWKLMQQLSVDFINTDKIDELAAFLNQ